MFVAGSVVELIDLNSGEHRYIPTMGGFSVGTLVVRETRFSIELVAIKRSPLGSSEQTVLCHR